MDQAELDRIFGRGLEGASSCNHLDPVAVARLAGANCLWAYEYDGWGPEHDLRCLLQLSDGSYAVLEEGEDSTGHGCQCSANVAFFPTLADAYRLGLTQDDRDGLEEVWGDLV